MKNVLLIIMFLCVSVYTYGDREDSIVGLQRQIVNQERAMRTLQREIHKSFLLQKKQNMIVKKMQGELLDTQNELQLLSKRLGTNITQIQKKVDANARTFREVIKSYTTYGIITIFLFVIVMGALFFILYKRIRKSILSVEKIKVAQAILHEESLNIDTKLVELLDKQISMQISSMKDDPLAHSLILKVADEIVRIEMNLSRMDSTIKGYKQLSKAIERIKDNFKSKGYEIIDMLGKPYNDGMKVTASFVIDEKLKEGEQIITGIIKPQVNYNEVMIQSAQITVSQNI